MAKGDMGALWVRRDKGKEYMTGYVEVDGKRTNIVCFVNGYKKEEKHPDYNILKSEPREQRSDNTEQNNPNPEMQPEPDYPEGVTEEDIPW